VRTLTDDRTARHERLWDLPDGPRRVFLLGPPLALAGYTVIHPQPDENIHALMDESTWFMAYHMVQLPLIGLVAISVMLLADQLCRARAWPTWFGLGTFLIFFSAYDTLAGIGTGLAMRSARDLPTEQAETVFALVRDWPMLEPFAIWLSFTASAGWLVAVGSLALSARRAGAPRSQWVFTALAAGFLMLGHPAPFGTIAFGSLFLAAVIHEWHAPHGHRPDARGGAPATAHETKAQL
jgi:hypothetical protein